MATAVAEADVLVNGVFRPEWTARARRLRLIHAVGAGYDGVHIISPAGQRIGQILPGDNDMRFRLRHVSSHMGRCQDKAVAKVNAISRPWLLRRAVDVHREGFEVGRIGLRPRRVRRRHKGERGATEAEDFRCNGHSFLPDSPSQLSGSQLPRAESEENET